MIRAVPNCSHRAGSCFSQYLQSHAEQWIRATKSSSKGNGRGCYGSPDMFSSEILTQSSSAWLCCSSPGLAHIADTRLTACLQHAWADTRLAAHNPPELVPRGTGLSISHLGTRTTLWSHWNRRTLTKGGSTSLPKPGTKQMKERPHVQHDSRDAKAEPHSPFSHRTEKGKVRTTQRTDQEHGHFHFLFSVVLFCFSYFFSQYNKWVSFLDPEKKV